MAISESPSEKLVSIPRRGRGRFPNAGETDVGSTSPADEVIVLTSQDEQTCLAALATRGYACNESCRDVNRKFDARFRDGLIHCGVIVSTR
jgi:hypothetical protein